VQVIFFLLLEHSRLGYKELNPHIGLIYGDSINLERQWQILQQLKYKGFASTNIVLGIGSYIYEYVTRDSYGFAMKATWGQTVSRGQVEIFKDPKTDDGMKKSHKGMMKLERNVDGKISVQQQVTMDEEHDGLLETVFLDGKLIKDQTLQKIRELIESQL